MSYLEKEDLLIDLFQSLDLDFNVKNLDDLFSLTISQDKLKDKELINKRIIGIITIIKIIIDKKSTLFWPYF